MPQMHIVGGDGLVPMSQVHFASEDALQELLASCPGLMPGDLIDTHEPRRWVLVTREAGIALPADRGSRWSLDHLFLDQDGTPTLVEVKRAGDTRGRREVVAQMLDYAASLSAWPPGRVSEIFHSCCARDGRDADTEILDLIAPSSDLADFWSGVDTRLEAGRIRLVFVAEYISAELTQIIEFLNDQFQRGEVLAVEVRQWQGEGVTTLVSDVVGRTATAAAKARAQRVNRLTLDEFDALLEERSPDEAEGVRALMSWCMDHGGWVSCGTGRTWPACYLNWTTPAGSPIWSLSPTLPSQVAVTFDVLRTRVPFDQRELREELRQRLNQVPGIDLPNDCLDRRPTFPIAVLRTQEGIDGVIGTLGWFVSQLLPIDPPHAAAP